MFSFLLRHKYKKACIPRLSLQYGGDDEIRIHGSLLAIKRFRIVLAAGS